VATLAYLRGILSAVLGFGWPYCSHVSLRPNAKDENKADVNRYIPRSDLGKFAR